MTPTQLKQWRATLGLSQVAAARALGMSPRGYQMLEGGDRGIDRRTALACSAVLHQHPPYGG